MDNFNNSNKKRNKHPEGPIVYNLSCTKSQLVQKKKNLNMRASIKVKAGMRLSLVDARVGELRSMPT